MGLTSTSFDAVMAAAAVIAAAATLLLWNRIPGPAPVRVAGRLGLLLTGEALASAALLVTINTAYGGLFVSWQDLLGDQSTAGAHFAGQGGEAGLVTGGAGPPTDHRAHSAPGGSRAAGARSAPGGPGAPVPAPAMAPGISAARTPGRMPGPVSPGPVSRGSVSPGSASAAPAAPASRAPSASRAARAARAAPVVPGAPPVVPVRPLGADADGSGGGAAGLRYGGRLRFTPAGFGGFVQATLTGPVSQIRAQVDVWTPPQYAHRPRDRFPVLELLHGVPDSPGGWMRAMHVAVHLSAAIAAGKAHPYLLVIPEITPFSDRSAPWDNQECSNVPGDADVATWIVHDVRGMVLRHFRANPSAAAWGLMGYSTGGFCAAKLVLQYPGLYRAAVSLSGYYTPESRLLTDDRALSTQNSPLWVLGHERTPAVSLLMTASSQDRVDPPSEAQQMIQAARANPLSRATEVQSFVAPVGGGHNQGAWQKMLPTAFMWLSQRLAGPVPAAAGRQAAHRP